MSEHCPILTNYTPRKDGRCKRFGMCQIQGRTKNPRCRAKGDVKA